jgi:uncharacterized protein (TIGR02271 family)
MAETHRSDKDPEKTVDLPPYGSRNPDPVTDAAGSHPIETGVGAAIGGAASGAAVGAVGGPLGAVVGAIVGGGIAGGFAGKGIGELIDPTTEDNWLREYYDRDKTRAADATEETYRPAYRYGLEAGTRYDGRRWDEVESDLRTDWDRSRGDSNLNWDQARGAVHDAFDRTIRLHEERLKVDKTPTRTGEVEVRKEVHTENKSITVPVEREEVVIERRPASGRASASDLRPGEEIRIPVKEEKVNVSKETVLKEEVNVGKRKVQDTQTVSDDVRVEELKVEEKGDAKVRKEK